MAGQSEPSLGDIRQRLDELVERRLGAGFSPEHQEEYSALAQLERRALAERDAVRIDRP